jgi:hypothetical protein
VNQATIENQLAAGAAPDAGTAPGLAVAATSDANRDVLAGAATVPGGSPLAASARRLMRQPKFLCAAAILLISAVGLNGATQFLKLHFRKEAVPLPIRSLDDVATGIPATMGHWVQVSKDEPIDPDVEHNLGTKEYIFRDYVDMHPLLNPAPGERPITAFKGKSREERLAVLNSMKAQPKEERLRFLEEVQLSHPDGVVKLAVTYYTGLVDTVAHIPDRCYVADGYEPTSHENKQGTFGTYPDGKPRQVDFRFISFDDQTARRRVARNVGYLFHVNGEYTSDPLGVRYRLQNLFERYGYYAKVELMCTDDPTDTTKHEHSADVMKDFLTSALPEIESRLPNWQRVKAGGNAAPPQVAAAK